MNEYASLTFVASVITLWMIRPARAQAAGVASDDGVQQATPADLVASIAEGIRHVWNNANLRLAFILIAAVDFLVLGPLVVGLPVLADTRLPEGALAFGIVMSAFGSGALFGVLLAGALPKPERRHYGTLIVLLTSVFGVALVSFGLATSTAVVALAAFWVGAGNGYANIGFVTWLQNRVPMSMLGRVMSLMMFASVGVVPISQALCGALIKVSLTGVFVGAGVLSLIVTLRIMLLPGLHRIGLPPEDCGG